MSGRQSKRIGKEGEREAKRTLVAVGCYIADSEVQGLAGDDIFVKDRKGKWWSIEVKNTANWNKDFPCQAREQASERYEAIQRKLSGNSLEAEILLAMGVDTFSKEDWIVMWHPRNSRVALDTWTAFVDINGRIRVRHIDIEDGWCL
jgi:uncharacterized protein YgfB (UPF0149 family)